MKTKYVILATVAPAVVILDQITKAIIEGALDFGVHVPVIPGFFDIVHFRNIGAAFGMFSGLSDAVRTPFFYIVAAVATLLLVLFYRALRDEERLMPFALALVLGGIAGNIIDRARVGAVIDFLRFYAGDAVASWQLFGRTIQFRLEWPAFNVADMAISAAMVLIAIAAFRGRGEEGA